MLLEEALEEWLEERALAGGAASSLASARAHVGEVASVLSEELGRAARVEDWERGGLRRALSAYREGPDRRGRGGSSKRSSASVRLRLTHLRGFTRWLLAQELIERDQLAGIRVEVVGGQRPAPLSASELTSLIEAAASSRAGARDRVLLTLLGGCGCSLEEAAGIQVGDVDLAGGVMEIRGVRARKILLTPRLREAVEAYLPVREAVLGRRGEEAAALLLTGGGSGRERSLAKAVARAGVRSGLAPERVNASQLRASFAQLGVESGMSVGSVCAVMGISMAALRRLVVLPEGAASLAAHPLA